jgi:disulfide bond formation protein DsbB
MVPVETLNYLLALSTIVLQVLSAGFLAVYFLRDRLPDLHDIGEMLSRFGLWIGFLVSCAGVVVTLYYSEILGFEACFLCWWQRLFQYPQVILFAVALWNPEHRISAAVYATWFSVFGAAFALYHHALQVFPQGNLPCSTTGPSCAQITFIEFGYITVPMVALSAFAFIIVLMLFVREEK